MKQGVKSYNTWLREESQDSLNMLLANMVKLQVSLQALESRLELATIMEPSRVHRIILAISHLEVEIRLLVISLEEV